MRSDASKLSCFPSSFVPSVVWLSKFIFKPWNF